MSAHASKLAVQAAGYTNKGLMKAEQAGICAMCGQRHEVGEMVSPFVPTDSFMDYQFLRCKTSSIACGWCAAMWNDVFTQKALKTVICTDGIFPAASNVNIAYWLLNPPNGDWIWVMGDQKKQHIIWRSPVNRSREIFQIQNGEVTHTIRRDRLMPAVDASRRLADKASDGRKGAKLKSPFVRLSRDVDDPAHGAIRSDLHVLSLTNPDVGADIRFIQSLTVGEMWALTALLYAEPSEKPLPYCTPSQTSV